MAKTNINLPGLNLKNPVIAASGTFGFGEEVNELYDISILGGIATKATTLNERLGNDTPRVCEVYGGMLNAIGLANPGLNEVMNKKMDFLKDKNLAVLANVAGSSVDEYVKVAKELSSHEAVDAIELNISCPNVHEGGMAFGTSEKAAYEVTKAVVEVSKKPVYVKLSPNVSDIVSIAKAVEKAGAKGITMINTLMGMKIDLKTGRPVLKNKTGGFSGPAIKPVAIRMIYQVYEAVNIPIIGMGGIMSAEDILEFLYAGASAVQIGTLNLVDPYKTKEIIKDFEKILDEYGFEKIEDAIGYAHRK